MTTLLGTYRVMRENTGGSVDTAIALTQRGVDNPGNPDVPDGVTKLTEVRVSAAPDPSTTTLLGCITALTIGGAGLKMPEQRFLGPGFGFLGTTAWNNSVLVPPAVYDCDLPVAEGGQLLLNGYFGGEDVGDVTIKAELQFDGQPGVGQYFDYREADIAALNTKTTLNTHTVGTTENFLNPGRPLNAIVREYTAIGVKGVSNADVRNGGPIVELAGGLRFNGPYEFGGIAGTSVETGSAGDAMWSVPEERKDVIPIKKRGDITATAQMLEDDSGTQFTGMQLVYAHVAELDVLDR